jgi:hypothetical protein
MVKIDDLVSTAKELKGEKLEIETSDYVLGLLHDTAMELQTVVQQLQQQLTTAQENEAMLRSALSELVLAAINLSKYDDFSEPIPDCPHCNTINPKEFNDVRMEFDKVLSKVIGGE